MICHHSSQSTLICLPRGVFAVLLLMVSTLKSTQTITGWSGSNQSLPLFRVSKSAVDITMQTSTAAGFGASPCSTRHLRNKAVIAFPLLSGQSPSAHTEGMDNRVLLCLAETRATSLVPLVSIQPARPWPPSTCTISTSEATVIPAQHRPKIASRCPAIMATATTAGLNGSLGGGMRDGLTTACTRAGGGLPCRTVTKKRWNCPTTIMRLDTFLWTTLTSLSTQLAIWEKAFRHTTLTCSPKYRPRMHPTTTTHILRDPLHVATFTTTRTSTDYLVGVGVAVSKTRTSTERKTRCHRAATALETTVQSFPTTTTTSSRT